jgi:ADP-ribose pyrophosphatase YjhB (NUDIX family)
LSGFYPDATPILVAADCIIFGYDSAGLKLLLFKRKVEPFRDEWSAVGSFVRPAESVDAAAVRVLEEYTGLRGIFMEPLGCYGAVGRDPGGRVISQAYFALIRLGEEEIQTVETRQAHWFSLHAIPRLILDHNQMVNDALEKLRRKAAYRPIGFELLPEKFTIPQLQDLYEEIFQKTFDRRNFRKKILSMNILDKLDQKDKSGSRKGAFLYRFNQERYQAMAEKGLDFEI